MGAVLPSGYEDHYPYEKLTDEVTANIQRLRDTQMRKLRKENEELRATLYHTQRRLDDITPILEEMGIDIDVILATRKAFDVKRK